jgi:hypothetical protein
MDETDHGLTPRIADLKVNRKVNEINDLPTAHLRASSPFRRMRSREAIAQHDQGVARTVADCDRHLIACARATLQGSLGGPQRSLWGEGPKHVFLMAARALAP